MAEFLDPTGKSTYGIGICARCSKKMSLEDLYDDPNSPGLKVCIDDLDDYDPYRLAARPTEEINLEFVRPDEPLNVSIEVPTVPVVVDGVWAAGVWQPGTWGTNVWRGIV